MSALLGLGIMVLMNVKVRQKLEIPSPEIVSPLLLNYLFSIVCTIFIKVLVNILNYKYMNTKMFSMLLNLIENVILNKIFLLNILVSYYI